ncbi:hypothetical protein [Pseudoalteromonas xiamenensis]
MKKTTILLAMLSVSVLAGCANTNKTASVKSDQGFRCEKQSSLGTTIPSKLCSTKKQRDEAREASKEALRQSQSGILTEQVTGRN